MTQVQLPKDHPWNGKSTTGTIPQQGARPGRAEGTALGHIPLPWQSQPGSVPRHRERAPPLALDRAGLSWDLGPFLGKPLGGESIPHLLTHKPVVCRQPSVPSQALSSALWEGEQEQR